MQLCESRNRPKKSKQPIIISYLDHVTSNQGPVFPDSVGSWPWGLHWSDVATMQKRCQANALTNALTTVLSLKEMRIGHRIMESQQKKSLQELKLKRMQTENQFVAKMVERRYSRNRPKQVNNQSELVIWSRHCLSANQGPVFPDSVGS
eukprot:sb/3473655/